MIPVVPAQSNRLTRWEYDEALYKKRNELERLFHRIFSRFDKLDVLFTFFIHFALSANTIISFNGS
jgi:hypothetical protein